MILSEASVRIIADTRDGEREAAAAGEEFGRAFAAGADRTGGQSNLPATLARQVSDASQQIVAARREETAATTAVESATTRLSQAHAAEVEATGRVRDAETALNEVRSRGNASATELAAAEDRVVTAHRDLEQASRSVTSAQESVSSSTERLRQAHVATVDATERHSSALRDLGNVTEEAGGKIRGLGDDSDRGVSALDRLRGAGSSVTEVFRGGLVGNLAPFILPAISSIGALAGALALIPALVTAAGSAFAALKIGTSGIADTFKAFSTQSDAAGTSVAKTAAQSLASADSIINAQKGVADAIQNVADAQRSATSAITAAQQAVQAAIQGEADAQRNAANSIITATEAVASAKQAEASAETTAAANNMQALQTQQRAEESLTQAQQSALRAQQNLTDARQSAARSIEDLQNRVIDDALAQRHAIDQLASANAAFAALPANATDSQREQAQLAVDDAKQRLAEISLSYQRSQADAAAAAAAGVEGSKQVVSAQDQVIASQKAVRDAQTAVGDAAAKVVSTQIAGQQAVAAATQRVADTQRALVNAQISGAESVTAAQNKVRDSQQALVDAQVNGAARIAKAQEGVVTAQRALQLAVAQSAAQAETAGGSVNKFNEALAKLAPSAQDFVRQVIALNPAWTALKLDVQQRLFAGLGDQIRLIGATDLPVLRTGLGLMATALNGLITQVAQFVTSRAAVADYTTIFANSAKAVDTLKGAIQPLLRIFTDLAVVGSSFLPGLAQSFANAAQRAADFVSHARETGQLHTFIQAGIDAFKELISITKDVAVIFADVAAHPPFGPSLLDLLKDITTAIRWFIENVPFATTIIEAFIIAWRVAPVVSAIATLVTAMGGITVAGLGMVAATGGIILVLAALGIAIYEVVAHWDQITAAMGAFINYATSTFSSGLSQIGSGIASFASYSYTTFLSGLSQMGSAASNSLSYIGSVFSSGFSYLGSVVSSSLSYMGSVFSSGFSYLGTAALNGINYVISIVGGLPGRILSALGNVGSLLWSAGASLVSGFWDGIIARWDQLVQWIRDGLQGIRNLFPFSPAKEGPFSGRGYVSYSGEALTSDFAESIRKGIPAVVAAARQLAQSTLDAGQVDLAGALPSGGIAGTTGIHGLLASVQQTIDTAGLTARQAAPVSVVQNIYNPSMQDATDSSNRELRRFAALGGFTR